MFNVLLAFHIRETMTGGMLQAKLPGQQTLEQCAGFWGVEEVSVRERGIHSDLPRTGVTV